MVDTDSGPANPGSANPGSANPGSANPQPGRVVVVTGMSGAGKTLALKVFEDLGYEAVDNLPLVLLDGLLGGRRDSPAPPPPGSPAPVCPLPGQSRQRPIAVGIDIRTRDFNVARLAATVEALRGERRLRAELLFLDADDEVLARRFTETRRRHPLGGDLPVADGIAIERAMIAPLRDRADLVLDTTGTGAADLRALLASRYATTASPGMALSVLSFGFRNGLPRAADLVFDVRFLRNPHYQPALRPLTGADAAVGAYVAADPAFDGFLAGVRGLLEPLLPRYEEEGKSYLTIAVGCTGGRHRSVYVAERLADWLRGLGRPVVVRHRDTPQAGIGSTSTPTHGSTPGAAPAPDGEITGSFR